MYQCLNEVNIGIDRGDDFAFPGLNDDATFITDPWDFETTHLFGHATLFTNHVMLRAKNDETGGKYKPIIEISNTDSTIVYGYTTSSRLVFLCPKWKSWTGSGLGLFVAAGANAYLRSKSPEGSKGMALLGHIRYEWLRSVGFQEKSYGHGHGWGMWGIYYLYKDDDDTEWCLSFGLNKFKNSIAVAQQATNGILQRAARYRLAMTDEKSPECTALLQKYANGKPIVVTDPKQPAWVHFPTYYKAPLGKEFRP